MKIRGLIAIILNYKDFDSSINIASRLLLNNGINKVIIVDNYSQNNSYEIISQRFYGDEKVDVILNNKNSGYAQGNNLGIRHAIKSNYIGDYLIVNPDTDINKDQFEIFLSNFYKLKDIHGSALGCVSPKIQGVGSGGWNIPTLFDDIIDNFLFSKRLIKRFKNNDRSYPIMEVEVVSGCFFAISSSVFKKINLFDEDTFLYCEERIIANKLKSIKCKSFIIENSEVIHNHTFATNWKSEFKSYKELVKSRIIYHKKYDKTNNFKDLLYKISVVIGKIERIAYFKIKELKNKL